MHGESRKPASFVDLEKVTASLLRDVARNFFDLKDGKLILQTYSKTFEEFVDAEDDEMVLHLNEYWVLKLINDTGNRFIFQADGNLHIKM